MDPSLCSLPTLKFAEEATTQSMVWGMPSWACWTIIAVLLLVSGLFSAGENAYSNCNIYHFQAEANKGSRTAKIVVRMVKEFDNTLITVLVGNNIIQTVMSFLSAMLFYNLCNANGWSDGVESILSTIVMAFLVYVVSDTVPKIISKAYPNKMASFLAWPVTVVEVILFPVILIFRGLLVLAHRILKVKDQNLLSKEDLMQSVTEAVNESESEEDGEEEKLFENDEAEIIDNVFTFDTMKVDKVYTPIEDVFSISTDDLRADVLNEKILECPYSRIPVYDGQKDNIVGVLVLKDYFTEYAADIHVSVPSLVEQPVCVSTDAELDDVFRTMNREKAHLALCRDGERTVGIVSMEDILEVLVEDISEAEVKA